MKNVMFPPPLQNDEGIHHGQRQRHNRPECIIIHNAAVQFVHEAEVMPPVVLEALEEVITAYL